MTTRRSVIELLAGGGAACLVSGCAPKPDIDPVAAWRDAGAGERDPRRWALAHAILAPNPHNRQPWLVDLPGTDEIVFYADTARMLPATDPPNRQITVGCGAFLELLNLAACERGLRADMAIWPEGEPQPLLCLHQLILVVRHALIQTYQPGNQNRVIAFDSRHACGADTVKRP